MQAQLLGEVLAEANDDDVVWIEGNAYFPPSSLRTGVLELSTRAYTCPWKGAARYFHIRTNAELTEDAAWSYPHPVPSAIRRVRTDFSNYIAFAAPLVGVR